MKIDLLSMQELDREKTAAVMCLEDMGTPLGIKNRTGKDIITLAQQNQVKNVPIACTREGSVRLV